MNWSNENVIYHCNSDGVYKIYGGEESENLWNQLCRESKASDFYVYVYTEPPDDKIYVMICPRLWFQKKGYCLNVTPEIYHLWPSCISGEYRESIMNVYDGVTFDQVVQQLREKGFVLDDPAWNEFCKYHEEQ